MPRLAKDRLTAAAAQPLRNLRYLRPPRSPFSETAEVRGKVRCLSALAACLAAQQCRARLQRRNRLAACRSRFLVLASRRKLPQGCIEQTWISVDWRDFWAIHGLTRQAELLTSNVFLSQQMQKSAHQILQSACRDITANPYIDLQFPCTVVGLMG